MTSIAHVWLPLGGAAKDGGVHNVLTCFLRVLRLALPLPPPLLLPLPPPLLQDSPFFVEKLQVRVLPCVVMFVGGVAVDRIVGFEPLGATDDFPTSQVPRLLCPPCCLPAVMPACWGAARLCCLPCLLPAVPAACRACCLPCLLPARLLV